MFLGIIEPMPSEFYRRMALFSNSQVFHSGTILECLSTSWGIKEFLVVFSTEKRILYSINLVVKVVLEKRHLVRKICYLYDINCSINFTKSRQTVKICVS